MPYEYQEYPKYLYHPKLAPEGKVFQTAEETKVLKKGWVDTPAKFPKPSRFKQSLLRMKPWWEQWKWLVEAIGAILAIAGIIVGFIKAR